MLFLVIRSGILIGYALLTMTILLPVKPFTLPLPKRVAFFAGSFMIFGLQLLFPIYINIQLYGTYYLFFAQLPTFLFFLWIANRGVLKTLFLLLTTIFLSAPGMTVSRICTEYLSLPMALSLFCVCLTDGILLWLIWHYMRPGILYILDNSPTKELLQFISVPLLYDLLLLVTGGYLASKEWIGLRLLITLSTMIAYLLLMHVIYRTQALHQLQHEQDLLQFSLTAARQSLQEQKAMQLQERIYRHDLHHHFALLYAFALENNLDKIKSYLTSATKEIDSFTPTHYCENETVQLIVSSFVAKATAQNVTLFLDLSLPEPLPFSDTELCALFSNALENAITAAAALTDPALRQVSLRAMIKQQSLVFSIENPYAETLRFDGPLPKTTHLEQGHGFGLKSILAIVEQYHGFYTLNTDHQHFCLQLMLPYPNLKEKPHSNHFFKKDK